ncbi:MAG: permease-like cell division protein FtsX [Oscillospiraceae bacterium]|nr:permease-like cell division protein FtsX [Candidatus Ruminococcus equi]
MSFSSFGYLIKEGFKNMWNNRMMTLASIGVLVSCLVLTGSALMLSINVSNIVDSVGDKNVTTVYLDDDISELEAVYIGKNLEKLDNITTATFYPKDEAIIAYKDVLGEEVFENMTGDDNPLPHAYHVVMDDLSKYDDTVKAMLKIDGVSSVSSRSDVAERLTSLNTLVTMMSFWIILALGIISLFIIANTIRMTMYAHRFEISIMKSVGATNSFVRIPFVIEGVVIGLISSGIAIGLLALLSNAVISAVEHILPFEYIPFSDVMWPIIGAFLVAGVLVGALGSLVSIRRYLKHEGNEILGW